MARSLQDLLATGEPLSRLANHGRQLLQLQHRLEATIPAALRAHARIANFRLGKLFIHADNSAVAAKVRQLGPRIASDLSSGAAQITQIEVKVQARTGTSYGHSSGTKKFPGEKQKQGLTTLASSLPVDAPIRKALEDLIKAVKA